MARKPYTNEEDLIIKRSVYNNNGNLVKAFKEASSKLKTRSHRGIGMRWYNVLRKEEELFHSSLDGVKTSNSKNLTEGSFLDKIINSLDKSQQEQLAIKLFKILI